jgi:hypothetical protein
VQEKLAQQGMDPMPITPAAFDCAISRIQARDRFFAPRTRTIRISGWRGVFTKLEFGER